MAKTKEKAEAIRLRVEERLSLKAISKIVNVSVGTLSVWLKEFRLTEKEILARMVFNAKYNSEVRKCPYQRDSEPSAFYSIFGQIESRVVKGNVAETAAMLRLCALGFLVYRPAFDGSKFDFIATKKKKSLKIQVKWATPQKRGSPGVNIKCSNGRGGNKRYSEGDFDFLIGYDYYTDSCYVWSWEEVKDSGYKSCLEFDKETWGKLLKE